jgi:hypothetical protein
MRISRVLMLALIPALLAGGAVKDLSQQVPKQVRDWKASGPDAVYDRKTLCDYTDGGAEVYLAYDFREVFVRKYGRKMTAPAHARRVLEAAGRM